MPKNLQKKVQKHIFDNKNKMNCKSLVNEYNQSVFSFHLNLTLAEHPNGEHFI